MNNRIIQVSATLDSTKPRQHYRNGRWKGDQVSYAGLHMWVNRHLGKPNTCEKCFKTGLESKFIHWANKSKLYKRDLNDWIRLCAKCHKEYDKKLIKTRVTNKSGTTGVHYCNGSKKWVAKLTYKGKTYCFGYYDNKNDAIKARKVGELRFYG